MPEGVVGLSRQELDRVSVVGARAPGPPAAPWARGAGAGGRVAAPLAGGPRRGVHARRVHRRRDEPAAAAAAGAGGDGAGLHGDARGVPVAARAHGGAVHGKAQRVPGQQPRAGGGAYAVHARLENAGHRAGPRLTVPIPSTPSSRLTSVVDNQPVISSFVPLRITSTRSGWLVSFKADLIPPDIDNSPIELWLQRHRHLSGPSFDSWGRREQLLGKSA